RSPDDQYDVLPFFGVRNPAFGGQGNVLSLHPGVPSADGQGNTTIERALPSSQQIVDNFPNSNKSTFYFKFALPLVAGAPAESNTTWGLVHEAARNAETGKHAYGSYSVLGRIMQDGGIDIRDEGTYTDLTTAALNTETWYETWFVVDHTANTFTQYIKGGTDYPTQTQLPKDAVVTAGYRNKTFDALESMLFVTSTGSPTGRAGKDPVYLDDFHIDVSAENLTSPAAPAGWAKIDDMESYTVDTELDTNVDPTIGTGVWNFYRSP
ncbi:uncharacterized protein METZ01_LOCUS432434, partial [marine metagenome]